MHQKWRDIILAVQNKYYRQDNYQKVRIGSLYQDDLLKSYERKKSAIKKSRFLKNYFLSEPFTNIYFTQREIECLNLLIEGYSNRKVSELLGLSERTVEFYIRNMREKTGTLSKRALVELMKVTEFSEKKDKNNVANVLSEKENIKKTTTHRNN